jgi:membrane-bound lytic murein transglycosylase A
MTIEQVSMQSIREWLRAHPTEAAEVMAKNPSYVFFREIIGVKTDQGPPGTLGVPMTPGRSLAVDRSVIPLGAPVWLDTTDPVDGAKLQRLMLAQDTGGAIHGAVRADVFWGWGAEAEDKAGRMRQQGRYFVLLPKE